MNNVKKIQNWSVQASLKTTNIKLVDQDTGKYFKTLVT